jgi:hypothetical protein
MRVSNDIRVVGRPYAHPNLSLPEGLNPEKEEGV